MSGPFRMHLSSRWTTTRARTGRERSPSGQRTCLRHLPRGRHNGDRAQTRLTTTETIQTASMISTPMYMDITRTGVTVNVTTSRTVALVRNRLRGSGKHTLAPQMLETILGLTIDNKDPQNGLTRTRGPKRPGMLIHVGGSKAQSAQRGREIQQVPRRRRRIHSNRRGGRNGAGFGATATRWSQRQG